jgi:type I restriction enzyme S subunit
MAGPGFAPALNAAEKELAALNHKLAALKRQKKGLMQQLLTGKVRVAVDCKK